MTEEGIAREDTLRMEPTMFAIVHNKLMRFGVEVSIEFLQTTNRSQLYIFHRALAAWVLYKEGFSHPQIGTFLRKDHSNIVYLLAQYKPPNKHGYRETWNTITEILGEEYKKAGPALERRHLEMSLMRARRRVRILEAQLDKMDEAPGHRSI